MTDRPKIHHRLYGIDEIGKAGFDGVAVDVDEERFPAGQFGDRMEDDETRSVGDEIGDCLAANLKAQASIRTANDFRRIAKFLRGVLCGGLVGDAKGFPSLDIFRSLMTES